MAAALAACGRGLKVVMTEESEWVGGQLTAQMVPPDEHPWIEQFGSTATYRALRDGIRNYYRQWYPLTSTAREWRYLNPGAGKVSKLCHEPRVALAVIENMLAPHRSAGRLTVLTNTVATAAETIGDRVSAVTVTEIATGDKTVVVAPYYVDATETGDLLSLSKTEYIVGAESQSEHGEPHAPSEANAGNLQGFTYCFAIDYLPGEDHTIDRPRTYDFWRAYKPSFWPGRLLGLSAPDPRTLEPVTRTMNPEVDDDPMNIQADQSADPGDKELWLFRRILAKGLFRTGTFGSDIVLVNWPMNDYWLGSVIDVDESVAAARHDEAKQLSLSLLYWLQTEAPSPDGGAGIKGIRLRADVAGTADGLARVAYHRESRRIQAQKTVAENDVAVAVVGERGSTRYPDSVGIGSYRIDLHPSVGGDNYIDIASTPFELPLGALVPIRMRNVIPGCKNIGTTHITNGCYRLHPVEWNIGEVAGLLAAHCVTKNSEPHQISENEHRLADFLGLVDRAGVERHWPEVRGY